MSRPSPNTVWARTLVDALVRGGVREASLAPGSRSTPLVLALVDHPGVRTRVHLDERCAAYYALGGAKTSGRPGVVVTTSGTAAANLLPAAVEASQSEAPLLLCTADRPPRLRGQDANQTVDQTRLFGPYVRLYHDPGLPRRDDRDLRSLDALAFRAVSAALGPPAGPVHLNLPFEKPLEPDGGATSPGSTAPGPAPSRGVDAGRRRLDASVLDEVADALAGADRGLLVCGPVPRPGATGRAALRLAEATGFPLLADPLSGARFAPGAEARAVGGYDLFLQDEGIADVLAPDLVLRVGASSTSRALEDHLATRPPSDHLVVDDGHLWKDHRGLASRYLRADPVRTCAALADRLEAGGRRRGGTGAAPWRRRWRRAERAAREAVASVLDGPPFEGAAVAELAAVLPEGGTLFVGNSMPIRDLDAFARPRDVALRVVGNRGASGIDGTVSTAFGAAAAGEAAGGRAAAVLGDLALCHDMNGLLAARRFGIDLCLVVIDNDGGGIFHMLPIREFEPPFTTHFATPHGLDFRHAARLYDLPFVEAGGREGVRRAVEDWLAGGGPRLVRVPSDREENRLRRRRAVEEVARSVRAVLEAPGRGPSAGA